jgi:bla regulator protein BlaR1
MWIIKIIWRWTYRLFAFVGILTVGVALIAALAYRFRNVDNVDLPFVDDPQAIGWWTSVDFVNSPQDFSPQTRRWQSGLFFQSIELRPGGKTNEEWMTWTKGVILNHGGDPTASAYEMREIDGVKYLFFQWKSGDYIYLHKTPPYYVLRYSGAPDLKLVDNIDLPFVNDPEVLGKWTAVDFVQQKAEFAPNALHWSEKLYLKSLAFLPNGGMRFSTYQTDSGSTPQAGIKWTKGVVMMTEERTASKYEIEQVGGEKFMFFEWKSGDYTIRHAQPWHYVLHWTGEVPTTNPSAMTVPGSVAN